MLQNTPGKRPTNLREVMTYIYQLEDQLRWVLSNIDGSNIAKGTVGTEQLATGAVTSTNIAKGAVNKDNMAGQAVTADKLTTEALQEIASKILASSALAAKVRTILEEEDIPYFKIIDQNEETMLVLEEEKIQFPLLRITKDNLGEDVKPALADSLPVEAFFSREDVIAAVQAIANGGQTDV